MSIVGLGLASKPVRVDVVQTGVCSKVDWARPRIAAKARRVLGSNIFRK